MPKFTISCEFDARGNVTLDDIRLLWRDALGEFVANRGENYVEQRYAGMSAQFKADKAEAVQRRKIIALHLQHEAEFEFDACVPDFIEGTSEHDEVEEVAHVRSPFVADEGMAEFYAEWDSEILTCVTSCARCQQKFEYLERRGRLHEGGPDLCKACVEATRPPACEACMEDTKLVLCPEHSLVKYLSDCEDTGSKWGEDPELLPF